MFSPGLGGKSRTRQHQTYQLIKAKKHTLTEPNRGVTPNENEATTPNKQTNMQKAKRRSKQRNKRWREKQTIAAQRADRAPHYVNVFRILLPSLAAVAAVDSSAGKAPHVVLEVLRHPSRRPGLFSSIGLRDEGTIQHLEYKGNKHTNAHTHEENRG